MLNTNISKLIIQAAFVVALIPNTSFASNHIQVGQPVKVFETNTFGNVTQEKLTVHLGENGMLVLARIRKIAPIAVPINANETEKLKALFAKGEDWATTAKENKVNIEKEIGTYEFAEKMKIKFTFVSIKKAKTTFIQMDMTANYRTATFFVLPKAAKALVALIERAPEAIGELQTKAEAEKKTDELFN